MPEGDTIYRTAARLRPFLLGQRVVAARARQPGPAIHHVVGATITAVEPRGKHLLISFDNGLVLHSHMRMNGVWHRYQPGVPWRRPEWRARVMLETPQSVAVCFDAPVVELFREQVEEAHPALAGLGPDLLSTDFDPEVAFRRMRDPARAHLDVGELLLDQTAVAGLGNIYKSEVLFLERTNPEFPVSQAPDDLLRRLLERGRGLIKANRFSARRVTTFGSALAPGADLWVYGRANRPCFRCHARIASRLTGRHNPRLSFWCPRCQPRSELWEMGDDKAKARYDDGRQA